MPTAVLKERSAVRKTLLNKLSLHCATGANRLPAALAPGVQLWALGTNCRIVAVTGVYPRLVGVYGKDALGYVINKGVEVRRARCFTNTAGEE